MKSTAGETQGNRDSLARISGILRTWYHVPVLLVAFGYMLWVRTQRWSVFVRENDVLFSGNDAWYHYRQVVYTAKNWPQIMPFDAWSYFPYGTSVGQFGTLYDQLVALAAILISGGSPTERQAGLALVFAPAVFGALTVFPAYLLGKRLGGRTGGLIAAVLLALLPGLFLQRSLVGASDHNGAEPFFQGFAVFTLMVALAAAEREVPVWEQFVDGDYDGLRSVLGWSILAGVAVALYLWVWPPGVIIVGIFGIFVLLKQVGDYLAGTSPEHIAAPAVIAMVTAGVLMILPIDTPDFIPAKFSLLQPLLAFAVAFGAVFLAWLARIWDDRQYTEGQYAATVFGLLLVLTGIVAVASPRMFNIVTNNLLNIVGFGTSDTVRTIGEAQPWMSRTSSIGMGRFWVIYMDYGMAFFTALVGALWLLGKPHVGSREMKRIGLFGAFIGTTVFLLVAPNVPNAIGRTIGFEGELVALLIVTAFLVVLTITAQYEGSELFVLIWAAFMTSAAFTQIRFNYYLAVAVVVLNAYLVAQVFEWIEFPALSTISSSVRELDYRAFWSSFDTSQMLIVVAILLLLFAPLATAQTVANNQNQQVRIPTAQQVGNSTGPGDYSNWESSLEWMEANTPTEGTFGGANNEFDYYGTFEQTDDHDYPEGAYGVMSWWDYGHWITVGAERIPNANPFQEGAVTAANYLLAPNEDRAEELLDELDEDDAKTRYVMVDWQMIMVQSKFGAPVQFYSDDDLARSDIYKPALIVSREGQQYRFVDWFSYQYVKDQRYYDSMMVRLYRYHGSAMEPEPIVVDWDQEGRTGLGPTLLMENSSKQIRQFDNMSAAREYVEEDGSAQVGGISNYPSEYVPALQHYRLVALSEDKLAPANFIFNGELRNAPAYVKTFERVPGATVEGTGPANSWVSATVTMRIPAYGQTFEYTQHAETDDDGSFEMVLPYSTTGYENWGPENGYTNVSIRADGPYEFSTEPKFQEDGEDISIVFHNETAEVTEAQVIGEDDSTVEVELERQEIRPGDGNHTDQNESASALGPGVEEPEFTDGGGADTAGSPLAGPMESTESALGASLALLGGVVVSSRRLSA